MASDPSQIIMGLLQTAGLGSTPNSVAAQNVALRGGQLQNQAQALQIAGAQAAQQREQQYTADLNAYYAHPTTAALAQLAARYPDHAEALKQSYTMMDSERRTSDQTAFGSLFGAAQSNRADLAVKLLQQRQAAERAAGHDTTELDDMLTSLSSTDPAAKSAALKQLQGWSQIHLAAADPAKFADVFGALGKGGEGFTLSQGQSRFDASGQPIASLAPKPDYLVVPEGGMAVPINGAPALNMGGGGRASGGAGVGPSSPAPAYTGPQIEQMAVAAVPGVGVSSRMRSREKQQQLYNDYINYRDHGGPWAALAAPPDHSSHQNANGEDLGRDFTPPAGMSQAQLRARLAARFPGAQVINEGNHVHVGVKPGQATASAAPQQGGVGPGGVIYGKPKPGYQVLKPEEVPAGLDPNTIYQRGPDGQITPVGGQRQGQLKAWPAPALNARVTNEASVTNIDRALKLLDPNNQTPAARAARGAVGFGTGGFGLWDPNRTDSGGADFRALVGQIGGTIIKDISGAAVSASEDDRLKKWVPAVTDSPTTIASKLRNLRNEIMQRNMVMDQTYSEDQGFRPLHSPQAPGAHPPIPKVGTVVNGYRYKGGDPASQSSWIKAK